MVLYLELLYRYEKITFINSFQIATQGNPVCIIQTQINLFDPWLFVSGFNLKLTFNKGTFDIKG